MEKRKIAPEEQFFPLITVFCYLMLDFYVKTRIRFSLRDKRFFEIIEVEMTRMDCTFSFFVTLSAKVAKGPHNKHFIKPF